MRTIHILGILVLLALVVPAAPAHAGGVVTVCDEAHLLAALAGGGTVTFACSGTILLAATITIAADTTIDASGHDVMISGNDAVRVFAVNSGATLILNDLIVADGSVAGRESGGGIFNDGAVTVSNSTFSANSATHDGGGINSGSIGTVTVTNSTFSGNGAAYGDGICDWGRLTLKNTIVSNSPTGSNCYSPYRPIIDGGRNLSYPDTTCPGIPFDPVLGPLQDNGGPTETI